MPSQKDDTTQTTQPKQGGTRLEPESPLGRDYTQVEQSHHAYQEAAKFDTSMDKLLRNFPPEKNPKFWSIYSRCIETTLDIAKEQTERQNTKPKTQD